MKVLTQLEAAGGEAVSADRLMTTLGLDRDALRTVLDELRDLDYVIPQVHLTGVTASKTNFEGVSLKTATLVGVKSPQSNLSGLDLGGFDLSAAVFAHFFGNTGIAGRFFDNHKNHYTR